MLQQLLLLRLVVLINGTELKSARGSYDICAALVNSLFIYK